MGSNSHSPGVDSAMNEKTPAAVKQQPQRQLAIVLGVLVALIVGLLLIGGLVTSFDEGSSDQAVVGETATPWQTKVPRPEFPDLPEGAEPVNQGARDNYRSGNFNNVWRGTPNTSADFALAVRETYVRHYLETGEFDANIVVFSEIVQRSFPLTCTDNDSFVTCALGNDILVYIA